MSERDSRNVPLCWRVCSRVGLALLLVAGATGCASLGTTLSHWGPPGPTLSDPETNAFESILAPAHPNASGCCDNATELRYLPLVEGRPTRWYVDPAAGSLPFEQGRSAVFPVAVTQPRPGLLLTVRAMLDRPVWSSAGTVFLPRVAVLDAERRLVRVIDERSVRARLSDTGLPYWEIEARLTRAERFVVVHTDSSRVGEALAARRESCTYDSRLFGLAVCPTGGAARAIEVVRAAAGTLEVELR